MHGTAEFLPRRLAVGPLVLDLFHRDALIGDSWLGLFPREFEVLWRLAETPGQSLTCRQLLADVWRIEGEPPSNRVAVAISRIRAKLHVFRLAALVRTLPDGGYLLDARPAGRSQSASALDSGGDLGKPAPATAPPREQHDAVSRQ